MHTVIDLPEAITHDQLAAALKALGIPETTRVTSVHMDVRVVEVRGVADSGTEFSHRYFVAAAPGGPGRGETDEQAGDAHG